MTDPLRTWRRRLVALWLVGAPALLLFASWALALRPVLPPAPDVALSAPHSQPDGQRERLGATAFDADAFLAKLWNPPPQQEPAPTERPRREVEQPAPLDLQLIGIIEEHGERKAALYDPQSDTLFIVGDGERLQRHTVTEVAATYVEFRSGSLVRRLTLSFDESANPAPRGRGRS